MAARHWGDGGSFRALPVLLLLAGVWLTCCTPAAAQDRECYQFTWIKGENSTNCKEENKYGIPCYEPFIRTDNPDYPPNITALDEMCDEGAGNCAIYKCTTSDACLRWVKYNIKNKPLYMTLFCGGMVDITHLDNPNKDTQPVTNDCFLQKNGTETIEACSCVSPPDYNGGLCNSSQGLRYSLLVLLLGVAAGVYCGLARV